MKMWPTLSRKYYYLHCLARTQSLTAFSLLQRVVADLRKTQVAGKTHSLLLLKLQMEVN